MNTSNDATNPSYYTDGIETIDFINAKNLGFSLGNAVKYISRAGKKYSDKLIEDIFKAAWYVNHFILETVKKSKNYADYFEHQDALDKAIIGYENEIKTINGFKKKLEKVKKDSMNAVNPVDPKKILVESPKENPYQE